MLPQLGLVCISNSTEVRYRTVTRKRLLALSQKSQRELLGDIFTANIEAFNTALSYCERENISLYRILASIFPFADEDVGREALAPLAHQLASAGQRALALDIRLVMHPDQFVVPSSD